jgi:hypothetical protein
MKTLARLALATVMAVGLTTAGILAAVPVSADTDRTDCTGNNCVHVHCYNNGACDRTNFDQRNTRDPAGYYPGVKPRRYACDAYGSNCHWTRNYFYNLNGQPIYDPSVSEYPH